MQSESPFLHDVSKHEIFTLIDRVFSNDKISETKPKQSMLSSLMQNSDINYWTDIQ